MTPENDDILNWKLEAYGTSIRGDENTSEDQIASACNPEVARRLVLCWNRCVGMSTDDLELHVKYSIPLETIDFFNKVKNKELSQEEIKAWFKRNDNV